MQVTRRYWTVAAVGAFLAVWGALIADPLGLLGSAAVGAFLLARQYRFVRAGTGVSPMIDLSTRDRLTAEETSELSVRAHLDEPAPAWVTVTVAPPVGASGEPASVTLEPGERDGVASTTLSWPVAGSFTVDDVELTITDDGGLFRQSVDCNESQAVQVSPRAPHDLHVGAGGDPVATGFGERESSHLGTGIEPAEVREYVPGDAVRQIDWKATARLDQPHVMEFEGGADRQTILVFDHRGSMDDGRPGTTKLDYARQLAVAFVDHAHTVDDGIGYYAVGDEGVTTAISPLARTGTYSTIRDALLTVTTTSGSPEGSKSSRPTVSGPTGSQLQSDDSTFGRTLAPFLTAGASYHRRFEGNPLVETVRVAEYPSETAVQTIIVTDDTRPDELREAVARARENGSSVAVFLTPTVLFDEGELVDLAAAYDDYVAFEEFRREFAGMTGVDAYEVGPGDRLTAIVSAGHSRRRGSA